MPKKDQLDPPTVEAKSPEWTDYTGIQTTLERTFGAALKTRTFSVGSKYPRTVGLFYLEGTAPPKMIEELMRRIAALQTDWVAKSIELPRLMGIQSHPLFPKFQIAPAPEIALSALYCGEVILAVENDPALLTGPTPFLACLQNNRCQTSPWRLTGLVIRLFAFGMAVFSASTYIAFVSYQYFALPLKLFYILFQTRMESPFPPWFEVLFLELLMEFMREGTERIKHSAGSYLGVVAGLAIAAGLAATHLVNPFAALLCGISQIAMLALPIRTFLPTIRWLKLGSIIMTIFFGILGTVITASLIVTHLVSVDFSEICPPQAEKQ